MDPFDLRDRDWLPVRETDGTVREAGLEEVMLRAHELRQVEGETPLETISLYRLLVGLAHHLMGNFRSTKEWAAAWVAGRFDELTVAEYFRESPWANRFRLFDESFPFWQCPDLTNIDSKTEAEQPILITTLLHQVASGNNKTLFSHRLDTDVFHLTPAEAARTLVTAQYFSVGGLNKKTSNHFGSQENYFHAPFVAGMPSIVMGDTLFETIVLNMLSKDFRGEALNKLDLGLPPWAETHDQIMKIIKERRAKTKEKPTIPESYLEYLLPRSRHIRLLPEQSGGEAVTVRRLHIAQGVAWESSDEPWFVKRKDKEENPPGPLKLNPDRAVWRNSAAYLGWRSEDQDKKTGGYIPPENLRAYGEFRYRLPPDASPAPFARLAVFALANDKAKSLAWRHETLDLPVEAMEEDDAIRKEIAASLDTLERVADILRGGVARFYREALPNRKADSGAALRTYWGNVEEPFRGVLVKKSTSQECIDTCINQARAIFKQTMNAFVGTDLRLFPARAQAEGLFAGSLKKLKKELLSNDKKEDH